MKTTDNYKAKYRLWAEKYAGSFPEGPPVRLPHFRSRRFSSHAEMNTWKQSVLRQLAESVPTHE